MRGIFLVSCFLGGSALLAGCREENNSPRPATEDAARITSARQWGESRSALQKRELDRAAGPALPIPDDLPYREERSSWGVPRKSRTGNRTKVRSIK